MLRLADGTNWESANIKLVPYFDGPVETHEVPRLQAQQVRITNLLLNQPVWMTLSEIASLTRDPEASISAQLRHLRKPRFGSYTVNKRRREAASTVWEYQIKSKETRVTSQKAAS